MSQKFWQRQLEIKHEVDARIVITDFLLFLLVVGILGLAVGLLLYFAVAVWFNPDCHLACVDGRNCVHYCVQRAR